MPNLPIVLVVDDEVRSLEAIRRTLEEEFEVLVAASAAEAEAILQKEWVQVILCDQRMPGETGVSFLERVRETWPDVVRMVISGYTDTEDIIAGINRGGIYQYIVKPWHPETLLGQIREAARLYQLEKLNGHLALEMRTAEPVLRERVASKHKEVKRHYDFSRIVRSADSPLNALCETVQRIAAYDISILITGESGTGKELLARAVHYGSNRAEQAFVVENCGALPDQLLESELFGHKKGAYTGAYEDRVGLFELASGGTLFLDEIGETSPAFQVKLLRVLQEGEIRPLGSSRTRKVDVRVIAATNRDLEQGVRDKLFRQDLYYRVASFTVQMPPLRQRAMDIPLIAQRILDEAMRAFGKNVKGISREAMESLCAYSWPGNVRELQNEICRMLALANSGELGAELLSPQVLRAALPDEEAELNFLVGIDGSLKERMEKLEGHIIRETLIRHRWNKSKAARELGLSRVGLRGKLARYDVGGE
ncbi:MAG: sigma-54 dependent transcriptional regulator [Sulfuricellaceae bacterium]|nr:sigma-54 dependent transcriptional regulator [Sulfuricellaceae bacterium]